MSDDADREDGAEGDDDQGPSDHSESPSQPIDGTPFMKAAALASVPPDRLDTLLKKVQRDLGPRLDDYRREYERIVAAPDREAFLAGVDHWEAVADRLELTDRERDAVVRAHVAAVERLGTEADRRAEFETALEIRAAVVVGVSPEDNSDSPD